MRSKARILSRCGLIVVIAFAVAAAPSIGFATTRTHADPSEDVQVNDYVNPVTVDPENTTADIVSYTITHTTKRVTGKVKIQTLTQRRWEYYSRIKTPTRTYVVELTPMGHLSLYTWPGQVYPKCPNRSASINHTTGTVAVRIPSACLDHPAWVRFAIHFASWNRGSNTTWFDQPFGVGGVWNADGDIVYVFSKRLRP